MISSLCDSDSAAIICFCFAYPFVSFSTLKRVLVDQVERACWSWCCQTLFLNQGEDKCHVIEDRYGLGEGLLVRNVVRIWRMGLVWRRLGYFWRQQSGFYGRE